ncbi:MAG: biotin synthase BioB [Ruminococcus sp.]|nr:biotin synthase BioB [Ruminococcus sp.]
MSELADRIINGRRLNWNDDLKILINADIHELCRGADKIRSALCGNDFDLCSIINGKSGRCSENCRFCAQSSHNRTKITNYDFLNEDEILNQCQYNAEKGVRRFAIVTAGRSLNGEDFRKAVSAFRSMSRQYDIKLCASMGLLESWQFLELKSAGVSRYHCNIETSRHMFPKICTTHTYDEKIECIKRAKECGLAVCSGGIMGMGETWEDRIDMALSLAELEIDSVPLNILNPIKGTPLEDAEKLTDDDILRIVAVFRYILPEAYIRLAGGRELMTDKGKSAFQSGANAAITGDMLTTSGISIDKDKEIIKSLYTT